MSKWFTGVPAAPNPGKGSTKTKTVQQPDGAGAKGTTSVTIRNVNTAGVASGQNRKRSPQEAARRLQNVKAVQAEREAKFFRAPPRSKFILGRKAGLSAACKPSLDVYLFSKAQVPSRSGAKGDWICSIQNAIKYRELKYQNQENEFRVFIEGAEVTHYIEGSLSWTVESTGGMNTARFVLNNNEDIFIITPSNVCAGPYSRSGWRVKGLVGTGKSTKIYDYVFRQNFRTDEAAKWKIYKTKYEIVAPDTPDAQIDAYTGMWLYPLNPYSCIFNRNDVVRIFVRIPHISSVKRPGYKEWFSLWMPAFTGFVKDYNWNDDPVAGKRVVNITCYDYRGLMDRMRIRTNVPPDKGKSPKPGQKKKSGATAKGAGSSQTTDNTVTGEPAHLKGAYLKAAQTIGARFESKFGDTYRKYNALLAKLGQPKLSNPYEFANKAFDMVPTLDDLHALWFANRMFGQGPGATKKGCAGTKGTRVDFALGRQILKNPSSNFNATCSQAVVYEIDSVMSARAANITRATAKLVNNFAIQYELVGNSTQFTRSQYSTGRGSVTTMVGVKYVSPQSSTPSIAKSSCVLTALKNAQNEAAKRLGWIKQAVKDIYLFNGFFNAGSLAAADAVRSKNAAGLATLKQADKDIQFILSKSALLEREDANNIWTEGSSKRVVSVRNVDTAGSADAVRALRANLVNLNKSIACLKRERDNPSGWKTYKCNPKQTGARSKEAIRKDIYATEAAVSTISAAIASVERKRGRAGVGKGTTVYNRLNFKYPSLVGMATLLATGAKIKADATSISTYKAKNESEVDAAVAKSVKAYMNNFEAGKRGAQAWAARVRGDTQVQVRAINAILKAVEVDRQKFEKLLKPGNKLLLTPRGLQKIKEVRAVVRATTTAGKKAAARIKTLPEVKTKFAHFETKQAGLFADLVSSMPNQPHPLMGKSFEMAVEYLCCTHLPTARGVITSISSYNEGTQKPGNKLDQNNPALVYKGDTKLDQFNRVVLFGVVGRPLTFQEVSAIGRATVSDLREDFSPFNIFWHMLRPASGTSPATILQQQTGQTGMNSTSVNYETRRKLLDDICSILDYQFYVSGWGDLVFEMPNYNAFPGDFGSTFKGAYTLVKDWKTAAIAEEAQEIPTAWIITGLEPEASIQRATKEGIAKHEFRKIVIMAPILARRLGVRVQNVNLRIPGIGAPAGNAAGSKLRSSPEQALDQLEAYGWFYIQRQLGRAHTVSVSLPFRPYIVPNRPIWLVHRQRIGLVQNVTHTMNPPNGECLTDISMGYTRWLHRDGTFRFMAGGQRQPIDYTSFFTGVPNYMTTNGVRTSGKSTTGKAVGRSGTGVNCAALNVRAREANAFSAAVSGYFGPEFRTPSQAAGGEASSPRRNAADGPTSGYRKIGGATSKNVPSSGPDASALIGQSTAIKDYFRSPWQYLKPGRGRYESFGYLRKSSSGFYGYKTEGKGSNQQDYYHGGWDIGAMHGTHALTPVPIFKAQAHMKVGPLVGATSYAYIHEAKIKSHIHYFAVKRGGAPVKVGNFVKIYADQYVLYRGIRARHGASVTLKRGRGGGGLQLTTWGYYKNSKVSPSASVLVCFRYVHNADLWKVGDKTLGLTLLNSESKDIPIAKAGDTVCIIGSTGANTPHLHVGMWLAYNKDKTSADKKLVDMALAANKQFIDSTLMARAKGWEYDGTDPRNKVKINHEASKYWQSRLPRLVKGLKRGKVTVADVVKFYQSRRSYKDFVPGDHDKPDADFGAKWVLVNPALFFAPSQFIGKQRQRKWAEYGPFVGAAAQLGTARYTRRKMEKKFCRKYSEIEVQKARAAMTSCDMKYITALNTGKLTKKAFEHKVRMCKAPHIKTLTFVKRGHIDGLPAVTKSINKEIDSIARRLETSTYLKNAQGANALSLAFLNFHR